MLVIIIIVMRFIQAPPARMFGATLSQVVIDKLIDWLTFYWLAQTLERKNLITYHAKGQKVDNKKINK